MMNGSAMNSSILALFAVAVLFSTAAAVADDVPGIAPLPIPQSGEAVEGQAVEQGSVIISNNGRWNRGMMANDGAQFSGAAPYSAPYIGGAWEGSTHIRYPYYSYRRNWDYAGPVSVNVTIIW
jgi:hypothetical protein